MSSPVPPPTLLHYVRRLTNKLLAPAGFAINRVPKSKWNWGHRLVPTEIGRFTIQVPVENAIATHYARYPHFSRQLGRLASAVRKKYPQLATLDIGANVGDTVCIFKSAEDMPILCIEGDDFAYEILLKNIAQFQNTTAHKLFLAEKTGGITATFEKAGWNTTITPSDAPTARSVNMMSFDDFILPRPERADYKLLKIDTEGFDCAIIRGAVNFIKDTAPIITFEYNRENMDAIREPGLDTLSLLADLGYSRILFHDSNGRFLCSTSLTENQLLRDLHEYADGKNGAIYYYDVTVFHKNDDDIGVAFAKSERLHRAG